MRRCALLALLLLATACSDSTGPTSPPVAHTARPGLYTWRADFTLRGQAPKSDSGTLAVTAATADELTGWARGAHPAAWGAWFDTVGLPTPGTYHLVVAAHAGAAHRWYLTPAADGAVACRGEYVQDSQNLALSTCTMTYVGPIPDDAVPPVPGGGR